jgi:hypothetical protein
MRPSTAIGRRSGEEWHRLQRGAVFVPGLHAMHLWSSWCTQWMAPRRLIGLRVLALLLSLALLLAFGAVVRGAVREGEVRRAAAMLRADATWRCQSQHGRLLRDACVANLGGTAALTAPYAQP